MSILFKLGAWVLCIIEGKMEGRVETLGRWGRRSKKPLILLRKAEDAGN
jgi:hypothetical protein